MKLRRLVITTLLSVTAFAACDRVVEGTEAYYQGEFEKAIKLLKPVVDKYAKKETLVIKIQQHEFTNLAQVLTNKTTEMYLAWEGYAGSLLGLNRVYESCEAITVALRPLKLEVPGDKTEYWVDPWDGDFWQDEVRALRSFYITMDCDSVLADPPEPLL